MFPSVNVTCQICLPNKQLYHRYVTIKLKQTFSQEKHFGFIFVFLENEQEIIQVKSIR